MSNNTTMNTQTTQPLKHHGDKLAQPPAPEVAQDNAKAKPQPPKGHRLIIEEAEFDCLPDRPLVYGATADSPNWELSIYEKGGKVCQLNRMSYSYAVPIHPDDADKPAFDLAAHVQANGFRALVDGEQFHRLDWTAEMLPAGTRPCLLGEIGSDMESLPHSWWLKACWPSGGVTKDAFHHRTTAPLPDLPVSTQGKSLGEVLSDKHCEIWNAKAPWHTIKPDSQKRWEIMAQAVRAAVDEEYRTEVERLKVQMQNSSLAAQEQCERAKVLEQRVKELEAERNELQKDVSALCSALDAHDVTEAAMNAKQQKIMLANANKYVEHLKTKISNQRTRLNYLEGATHHAGGTPLSRALARISELERELEKAHNDLGLLQMDYDKARRERDFSTLRPISEAGDVPEGCVRVYAFHTESSLGLAIGSHHNPTSDTHYCDIRLPDHLVDANKKDEPAWIEHDGGTCPLVDGEVEEFEVQYRNGLVYTRTSKPSCGDWKHIHDGDDITHYRVLKWKPGYTATTITGSDGKVYTRHKPGDKQPCDANTRVFVLFKNGTVGYKNRLADCWYWSDRDQGDDIIGWRYADEPAKEPVIKPELFNESKWIWMMEWCRKQGFAPANHTFWDQAEKQWNNRKLQD